MDECLYRCGSNAPSTQKYHVYPASASNLEIILEAGVVCDSCNAYFSRLENYFVHHHPGAVAKLTELRASKKGKPPKFVSLAGIATRKPLDDGNAEYSVPLTNVACEFTPNGDVLIRVIAKAHDFNATRISRLLGKIAVETVYAHGAMHGLNLDPFAPEYEPLVRYVRFMRGQPQFVWFAYKHVSRQEDQPRLVNFVKSETELYGNLVLLQFPGVHYMFPLPPFVDTNLARIPLNDWTFVETGGMHSAKDFEAELLFNRVAETSDDTDAT